MLKYSIFLLLVFLLSCSDDPVETSASTTCYQLPVGTHLPRLSTSPDELYLSYVSSSKKGDTLRLTKSAVENHRQTSVDLASGTDWFVNWADFPSVAYVDDGVHGAILFYHYLKYSAEGTYDYDVMYDLSDGGGSFYTDQKLHTDTVSAEHGFVSTAPLPGGGLQVTWLDGRYTKTDTGGADAGEKEVKKAKDDHGHGAGGAMTLRTKALGDSTSTELDHRVCDCCNTATVATDSLVMVAYRDRSEHEIRDISYVVKKTGDEDWSTPKTVHADNWEISGCPVNGPALAASGPQNIALVWYTAPAGRAQINFSRYDVVNDRFHPPLLLDDDSPFGRVDLQLGPDGTAYATGLTAHENPDSAKLTLWTIPPNNELERQTLCVTSPARSSGFPKTALHKGKLYWTRTVIGSTKKNHRVEVCWREF